MREIEKPETPTRLYKYRHPDRIDDVLLGQAVRFTPLVNTNDTFEIRSTFEKFAGPRFLEMLDEQIESATSEKTFQDMLKQVLLESGLSWLNQQEAIKLLKAAHGNNIISLLRAEAKQFASREILQIVHNTDFSSTLIEKMGKEILCFSLSERSDSSPMWAHYADNHKGFVVAFHTENDFFKADADGANSRLHKVKYFDGKIEEPLEDAQAAFVSKTADWSYEREWRVYCKEENVNRIFSIGSEKVHLVDFPISAVQRIIIGNKASAETVNKIKMVCSDKYPRISIFTTQANRNSHSYTEVPV